MAAALAGAVSAVPSCTRDCCQADRQTGAILPSLALLSAPAAAAAFAGKGRGRLELPVWLVVH